MRVSLVVEKRYPNTVHRSTLYVACGLYGGAIPHLIDSAIRSGRRRQTGCSSVANHACFPFYRDRNRPNQEILVPEWLITSHLTLITSSDLLIGERLGPDCLATLTPSEPSKPEWRRHSPLCSDGVAAPDKSRQNQFAKKRGVVVDFAILRFETTIPKYQEVKLSKISHLCTKSSVFQPTRMNAGGQQEVYRHMKRHYDRLKTVAPATDTSPPRSMLSSTIARDRTRKQPSVNDFPLPVTSRFMEEQILERNLNNELISLPTKDSDIQSVLRHVPELANIVKFKSQSDRSIVEVDCGAAAGNVNRVRDLPTNKNAASAAGSDDNKISDNKISSRVVKSIDTSTLDLEGQYLKFVQDITREILISNITSDRNRPTQINNQSELVTGYQPIRDQYFPANNLSPSEP
eukprot:sb/3465303/